MSAKLLLDRIQERLDALGLSDRKACIVSGVHVDTIRRIRTRGQMPRPALLTQLEMGLKAPKGYFVDAAAELGGGPASNATIAEIKLDQVFVRGSVQAGVWREAIEWDADDWYAVSVPRDEQYRGIEHFGLEVRGNSMNNRYPPGTVLICIKFRDIDDSPRDGDDVICLRRSKTGEYEATVKEYRRDGDRHVLWPRSRDPEHQQPIILQTSPTIAPEMPDPDGIAQADLNGDHTDDGGESDLVISALVVQYIRTLDRRPRGD